MSDLTCRATFLPVFSLDFIFRFYFIERIYMIPTEPTTIHPDLLKDYIEPSLLGFNQKKVESADTPLLGFSW